MSRKKKVPRWKKVLRIRKTMATLILIGAVAAVAIAVANSRRTPIAREDTQMTPQDVVDLLPPEEEEESQQEETVGIGWNYPDAQGWYTVGDAKILSGYTAIPSTNVVAPGEDDVNSTYMVLINESNNEIVSQKNATARISPASMTKIMTVLVAAEHVSNLDDTVTISIEVTDYAYSHDCSSVGYLDGEVTTVRDLFYGTILPSGGDAALALVNYVAGSEEAFVEMMNDKLEELGLSETSHFTNCIGLYDENHYSTVYDMAMILKAAVENDWCREVLSAHVYTTTPSEQHLDGITISNWFLRRIEDKDSDGLVLCAKTGFVNQSGNCAASYAIMNDGTPYICVTADAYSSWRCIYDHVAAYSKYTP